MNEMKLRKVHVLGGKLVVKFRSRLYVRMESSGHPGYDACEGNPVLCEVISDELIKVSTYYMRASGYHETWIATDLKDMEIRKKDDVQLQTLLANFEDNHECGIEGADHRAMIVAMELKRRVIPESRRRPPV